GGEDERREDLFEGQGHLGVEEAGGTLGTGRTGGGQRVSQAVEPGGQPRGVERGRRTQRGASAVQVQAIPGQPLPEDVPVATGDSLAPGREAGLDDRQFAWVFRWPGRLSQPFRERDRLLGDAAQRLFQRSARRAGGEGGLT